MSKKIVFIAIAGFTGEVTIDNRVLAPPVGGRLSHKDYPLLVTAMVNGDIKKVGIIEMAAWCDRRIILFGRMDPDPEFEFLVRGLNNGAYVFEIDVDDAEIEMEDEDLGMRITRWRLVGARIGQSPCWRLPRVQIEEFEDRIKEKVTHG